MNLSLLTENEMLTWEAAVDKLEKKYMNRAMVRGVGVGYRLDIATMTLTNEICLTIAVDQAYFAQSPSMQNLNPTGNLPTQILPLPPQEIEALPFWKLAEPIDPLVGGAEIGNGNLCRFNAGSLGAIVFNSKGERLGLCVQHVIGDDSGTTCSTEDCPACSTAKKRSRKRKLTSWRLAPAAKGDPICQPNWNAGNEIGKLVDFDKGLDAAVFKLNQEGGRRVEAKINGLEGEIAEPILPPLGTATVFRGTKSSADGIVAFLMRIKYNYKDKSKRNSRSSSKTTKRVEVWMQRIGKSSTQGGDCGGIWVSESGRHPVGMHTGKHKFVGQVEEDGKKKRKRIEIFKSTAVTQLVREFHRFSFSPLRYDKLLKQKSGFYTRFVEAPNSEGFFALCCTTTGLEPLKVLKYDDSAKLENPRRRKGRNRAAANSDVEAYNGISAACLDNDLYAVWRAMSGNAIKLAKWDQQGERKNIFGRPVYKFYRDTQTTFCPALINHKDRLFMAFVDPRGRVCLRISNGVDWNICKANLRNSYFGTSAASAPAMASWKNKLFLAWKFMKNMNGQAFSQIRLMEIKPSLNVRSQAVSKIVHDIKLPAVYSPVGDFDITISEQTSELVLAYSEKGGGLNSVALPISGDWTHRPWRDYTVIQHQCMTRNPPTLFSHDGRVICSRELSQ